MNNSQKHAYRHWLLSSRVVWLALVLVFVITRPAFAANTEETPPSAASSGWTPFQFAVWHPVQVFDENTDVYGLRTSLFYGRNRNIYGIDFSLFSNDADDIYGLSIQVFGNKLHHGIFPFTYWSLEQKRAPNIHGIQIGGGAAGFIGILFPFPIGYYAAISTRAGDVDGAQISLIANSALKVRGIQLAGITNYAESDLSGLQIAAIGNRAKGEGVAFQIGGIGNLTEGDYGGLQLGLFGNYNEGDYAGLQLSGLLGNVTYGRMRGFQMNGLWNTAGEMDGVQLSSIFNRVRQDGEGVQIGLLNISGKMKGLQIGAINYCRQLTGVQIGGINIIKESPLPFFPIINASF